jgi:hypothetical protein
MIRFSHHLSDEALLLVGDGEISPHRRLLSAERHLSGCETCRVRRAQLEDTLLDAFDAQRAAQNRPLPPAAPARARLARSMAADPARATPSDWGWISDRGWLYGAAVLLLAVTSGLVLQGRFRAPAASGVFLLPRAELTPGAAAPVALREICAADRAPRTQPIPGSVHQAVFARYGADYRRAAEYELDYLITPELGGIADPRNLWPQPFARTPWNAYVKDELERLLHRRVCDGHLDLATAQREMAMDWISAYKRHFETDTPLRDYEAAPLTALDRDLILAELEERGVSPAGLGPSDGPSLFAMLQMVHDESH